MAAAIPFTEFPQAPQAAWSRRAPRGNPPRLGGRGGPGLTARDAAPEPGITSASRAPPLAPAPSRARPGAGRSAGRAAQAARTVRARSGRPGAAAAPRTLRCQRAPRSGREGAAPLRTAPRGGGTGPHRPRPASPGLSAPHRLPSPPAAPGSGATGAAAPPPPPPCLPRGAGDGTALPGRRMLRRGSGYGSRSLKGAEPPPPPAAALRSPPLRGRGFPDPPPARPSPQPPP